MIKSFLLIVLVGGVSFSYTDLRSSSVLYAAILPAIDFLSLMALALWVVVLFHRKAIHQTTSGGGGEPGSFGDFDGGGGGDGGC